MDSSGVAAVGDSVSQAQPGAHANMSYKHKGGVRIDVDARGC